MPKNLKKEITEEGILEECDLLCYLETFEAFEIKSDEMLMCIERLRP